MTKHVTPQARLTIVNRVRWRLNRKAAKASRADGFQAHALPFVPERFDGC